MTVPSQTSRILPLDGFGIQQEDAGGFIVTDFGGYSVPEEGITLPVPGGGALTVWPDGTYAFEGPFPGTEGSVDTYYSYGVDFFDGTSFTGSFALGEQAPEEAMPDFQSWSLDDILALEDIVGLSAHGPVAELSGFEAGGAVDVGLDPSLGAGDLTLDILEHAIKTSCES